MNPSRAVLWFVTDGGRILRAEAPSTLRIYAVLAAVVLHMTAAYLMWVLQTSAPPLLRPLVQQEAVSVDIITVLPNPLTQGQPVVSEPIEKSRPSLSKPKLPDIAPPPVASVIEAAPQTAVVPIELSNQSASSAASTVSVPQIAVTPKDTNYVPSRWALEPPLAKSRLEGLGFADDVDCLRSLSEDCKEMRKAVFAEFQLNEIDKVWTRNRADTGLSAAFHGLSEREIRLKLGMHIAGENGLFIPFTNIGIDGPIWDAMHGVSKSCFTNVQSGKKSCPDSLSSADNRKYYIPPMSEP